MNPIKLAVKIHNYALAHYDDGKGWDVVVECYSIKELAEEIKEFGIKSVSDYYKKIVSVRHEVYLDVVASGDW